MIISGVEVCCKIKEDQKSYIVELTESDIFEFKKYVPYVFLIGDDTCYCNGARIDTETFNQYFQVIKVLGNIDQNKRAE